MVIGLSKLSKQDPLVRCSTEASGEQVIACSGELHAEVCKRDLERNFAKVPLVFSDPVVQYKETVSMESDQECMSKSSNKLNRIFARASALDEDLVTAIEEDKIGPMMDPKVRKTKLRDEYNWDAEAAGKIWCFGPEQTGPNILVNSTT